MKELKPKKRKKQYLRKLHEKPSCQPTYDPYKAREQAKKNAKKNSGETVYVYAKYSNRCTKSHRLINACMAVNDLIVKKSYNISLFYCPECDKYYTHISAIQGFIKNSKRPAIKYGLINCGQLRQQSILNLYGYTAQKDGLSEKGRRRILENLIDKNLMRKIDITNLLQHLINYNGKSDRMYNAVQIWESDLKFVSTYTKDAKMTVSGTYNGKELRIES